MRNRREGVTAIGTLVALLATTGTVAAPAEETRAPASAAAIEAEKERLLETDREFSRLSGEIGIVEALYRFQAEEAFLMNSATLGREVTRSANRGAFDDRRIVHEPRFVDLAASGELGYTWGDWSSTAIAPDASGHRESIGGIYINVWKRQADGAWKLVVDGVTRLPAAELERFRSSFTR